MKTGTLGSPLNTVLGWAAAGLGIFLVTHAVVRQITRFDLRGKVVLITGGSRGFGLVLARHLAAKGAKLAICARSADDLELARQELDAGGAEILTLTIDVTENEEVKALIRDVILHYGKIDVLINNAGIIQVGSQELMGVEEFQVAMQTNFWAHLYAMHAVIPHFISRGAGRIVNITSIGGKVVMPHLLPYTARNFPAVGLSEGMHAELRKYNIQVTTIIPNLMRTGGPVNTHVKGKNEKGYAWLKHAGADALISEHPDTSAERVIEALEYGEAEVTLSLAGKAANLVKGLAPGWVSLMMGLANSLLPDAATGNQATLKGWQAESALSRGPLSDLSDQAATRNNEG